MSFIRSLSKKDFEQALFVFLGGIFVISLAIVYYIWSASSSYVDQIINLQRLSDKAAYVLAANEQLVLEQKRLQDLFAQEQDFNIKVFFEQFYKQFSITPEAGWDTRSIEINDKFTQTILHATFKGLTMQKATQIIDALDKKETIYIKEVTLRSETNQRIVVELKIGTVRPKKGISS